MSETEEQAAAPRRKLSLTRRVAFAVIAAAMFFAIVVVCDRVAGLLSPPETASLLFPSGSRVRHESAEFDVTVTISSAGIRDEEYEPGEPAMRNRIVTVGDSFTFGWGVETENAWPNVVERTLNENSEKGDRFHQFEVLNFGFPGASPLDYVATATKALQHFRPQVLIVGTLQGDDLIQLSENQRQEPPLGKVIAQTFFPTFRRLLRGRVQRDPMKSYRETFVQSAQYARSQFSFEEKMLYEKLDEDVRDAFENGLLNPSLVQRAIKVPDHFFLPCGEDAIDVAQPLAETLRHLKQVCDSFQCKLIVAVIPDGPYVSAASGRGMARVGYTIGPELLTATRPDSVVSKACEQLDIPFVIQTDDFRSAALETGLYFPLDGHFNEEGHALFAKNLIGFIRPHINKAAR